jgi:uncharacterized SAM-dependent methyltransferase
MHLVSLRRQHVKVPAAGLDFEMQEGESIWTESSYKFRRDQVSSMLLEAGFRCRAQWVDDEHGFALSLAEAA